MYNVFKMEVSLIKKRYIATFLVPLSLAAIVAAILTPTPERALLSKLNNYQNQDNVYSEVLYKIDEEEPIKVQQYKFQGEYYAKYYPFSGVPLIVNTKDEKVLFGNDYLASSVSQEYSREENSLFWFDKITSKDIQKGSVKRDKDSKEGYVYTALLKDETPVKVTFFNGLLKKIEYYNIKYSTQIVNLISVGEDEKRSDVILEVVDYKTDVQPSEDFTISEKANIITLRELRETMSEEMEDEEENIFAQIKNAFTEFQESFNEDEGDDEANRGTINPIEFSESGFAQGEKFRIMEPEDF